MKNVLFATTALVAFAGAAAAESHSNDVTLDWNGDFEVGYNDDVKNGVYGSVSFGVDVTVDLGDSVVGKVGFDFATAGTTYSYVEFDYDSGSSMTAMIRFGDLDDEGASERYYADRSGMAIDVENQDGGVDVVAEVAFGSIKVAAGCQVDTVAPTGSCLGMNAGIGATFGSIDLGIGYDDATGGQTGVTAVSADATFGSFDVGVSYATSTAQNSVGVEVGGTFGSVEVGAYYASNSVANDEYGVSVDYSAGALTVGVYYDDDGTATYGVDVAYDVSDSLTAKVGVFNGTADVYTLNGTFVTATTGTHYYAGIEYAVNDKISATLSYASAHEIGAPEYNDGISAFITAEF